jgi:aldehyde oxidoreductase
MKDIPYDASITTIEGISSGDVLHPLQTSWILHRAAQCGTCTPGFILSAKALLDKNANPTKKEVIAWFEAHGNNCGHICPETAADAVLDAAKLLSGEATKEELWLKRRDEVYTSGAELADAALFDSVTGSFETGTDLGLKLPEGALYAKLVCPSESRANVFSIDVSQAEKLPGVFKVITWKDVAGTNRAGSAAKILHDRSVSGPCDAVAAVLGFTPAAASEAADKVKVVFEALPSDSASSCDCSGAGPAVAFAYVNEKGKLVIHSQRDDLNVSALEDGIGIPHGNLRIVNIPDPDFSAPKYGPFMEGIAGVAAMAAGKPVYLEL